MKAGYLDIDNVIQYIKLEVTTYLAPSRIEGLGASARATHPIRSGITTICRDLRRPNRVTIAPPAHAPRRHPSDIKLPIKKTFKQISHYKYSSLQI